MTVARLIAELFAAFPQTRTSIETAEAYEKHLTRCDREALAVAIGKLIETSPKLPTIAEIRERVSDVIKYREGRLRVVRS